MDRDPNLCRTCMGRHDGGQISLPVGTLGLMRGVAGTITAPTRLTASGCRRSPSSPPVQHNGDAVVEVPGRQLREFVAEYRLVHDRRFTRTFQGHVAPIDDPDTTVTGTACHDRGRRVETNKTLRPSQRLIRRDRRRRQAMVMLEPSRLEGGPVAHRHEHDPIPRAAPTDQPCGPHHANPRSTCTG